MYKAPQFNTIRSILALPKTSNLQLVGHRLQTTNTAANEVKPKSRLLFYVTSTLLTGIVSTAGVVIYSKNDPKFRELLTSNIPGSDKFIKVCLFEDEEFINKSKQLGGRVVCKVARQVKSIKESISSQSNDFVENSMDKIKSVAKSLPTSIPIVLNHNEEKKPKEKQEPSKINSQPPTESIKNKTEPAKPKEKPQELPSIPVISEPPLQYTLEELETEILKKSSLGIDALKIATEALKEYSENVCKLIESSTEKIDPNLRVKLEQIEDKKNKLYIQAFENATKYKKDIIEKQKLLNNSKFEATPDKLAKTLHRTNEALEELTRASVKMENEEFKLGFIKKYKSNVSDAQANLMEELESLFPGSDIVQQKTNVKNNDYDIFLQFAMKKLMYYQDKLAKQDASLDRKVNNAMNTDFLNVENLNLMNSRLNSESLKLDEQFKSQLNEFNIKVDEDLQEQLKAHTQAHADLVAKAVDSTKEEIENRVRQELSVIEELERQKYKSALDSLKSDLQSVVNNVKEQAEKENKLFANQAIWEASEFLKSALTSSDNETPIDVKHQINTIRELGASDATVESVVSAVPSIAMEKGVLSKGQLKEDFNQVEKRIYQTALIPDDSFSLPLMAFSYLASLFVVRHSHISPNEVNNEEFDPSELNTYEIIERARYCVDRDDMIQALRYLNLLTGCSRVVAKDWMKEATVFLETKQAIDLLMSHVLVASHSALHST